MGLASLAPNNFTIYKRCVLITRQTIDAPLSLTHSFPILPGQELQDRMSLQLLAGRSRLSLPPRVQAQTQSDPVVMGTTNVLWLPTCINTFVALPANCFMLMCIGICLKLGNVMQCSQQRSMYV